MSLSAPAYRFMIFRFRLAFLSITPAFEPEKYHHHHLIATKTVTKRLYCKLLPLKSQEKNIDTFEGQKTSQNEVKNMDVDVLKLFLERIYLQQFK